MAEIRRYEPEPIPTDLNELPAYLEREFRRLAGVIQIVSDGQVDKTHAPPERVREGMIRFADGGNWDPGHGSGVYVYIGGWQKILTHRIKSVAALLGKLLFVGKN